MVKRKTVRKKAKARRKSIKRISRKTKGTRKNYRKGTRTFKKKKKKGSRKRKRTRKRTRKGSRGGQSGGINLRPPGLWRPPSRSLVSPSDRSGKGLPSETHFNTLTPEQYGYHLKDKVKSVKGDVIVKGLENKKIDDWRQAGHVPFAESMEELKERGTSGIDILDPEYCAKNFKGKKKRGACEDAPGCKWVDSARSSAMFELRGACRNKEGYINLRDKIEREARKQRHNRVMDTLEIEIAPSSAVRPGIIDRGEKEKKDALLNYLNGQNQETAILTSDVSMGKLIASGSYGKVYMGTLTGFKNPVAIKELVFDEKSLNIVKYELLRKIKVYINQATEALGGDNEYKEYFEKYLVKRYDITKDSRKWPLVQQYLDLQQMIDEFTTEVNFLKRLDHPNIVKMLTNTSPGRSDVITEMNTMANTGDDVWHKKKFLMVFELANGKSGKTFAELLKPVKSSLWKSNRFKSSRSPGKLLQYAYDIAMGMEYLHIFSDGGKEGADRELVIHRDLKPDNILVFQDEYDNEILKITDFGLSDLCKDPCISDTKDRVSGTPAYIAPELWRWVQWDTNGGVAEEITVSNHMIDVFSFALICYEIWARELAITRKELPKFQEIAVNWRPGATQKWRREKPSDMPDEMYDLLIKMWSQDPKMRPSFTEVCDTIETIAENGKIQLLRGPEGRKDANDAAQREP